MSTQEQKPTTVCSTGRVFLVMRAVNNFSNDIRIRERTYDSSIQAYTSAVSLELEHDEAKVLLGILRHQLSECDREECEYCNEGE